jgi:predicted nuclease with TOPRIM domain
MAVQGIEALDMLQTRLTRMLDLLAETREKNGQLHSRVGDLEKEVSSKTDELGRLQEEQARLLKVQEEHKQLVAEREIIRGKVEGMLKNLEKFDLP